MGTRVYILDNGTLVLDKSFITWHHGLGEAVRFPVWSALIKHDEGLFLVDSGYHLDVVNKYLSFEKPEQTPAQNPPAQLELAGVKASDIDLVINTHLHFDHCGYNKAFKGATFIAHKEELRHAYVPEPFESLGYHREDFDTPEARFELISGDYPVARGVDIVYTPGHTAGHISVVVELPRGNPMVIAGDCIFTKENVEQNVIPGLFLDPVAAMNSMKRLVKLAGIKNGEIFYSHDPVAFKGYKKAPDYYE